MKSILREINVFFSFKYLQQQQNIWLPKFKRIEFMFIEIICFIKKPIERKKTIGLNFF